MNRTDCEKAIWELMQDETLCRKAARIVGQAQASDLHMIVCVDMLHKCRNDALPIGIEDTDDLRAYIKRSVYLRAISTVRDSARQDEIVTEAASQGMYAVARPMNPLAYVLLVEGSQIVQNEIARLPEVYRAILALHREGITIGAICEELTLPTGTVCSYLSRAKARLSARFEASGYSLNLDDLD